MPTLLFSDHAALSAALASGVLPPDVVTAPARAGVDARRRVWLQSDAALPRDAAVALARLGVAVQGGTADVDLAPFADWLRLIPLLPAPIPADQRSPVLFELDPGRLPRLWAEVRRLNPDSTFELQSSDWQGDHATVLVRVTGVPPFTLLRPTDDILAAFHEQAPGVWVEVGYRHPFAAQVRPASRQLTLIRAPDRWTTRRDGFSPTPDVASFPVASALTVRHDRDEVEPLELPLRLANSPTNGPAELWVIQEKPFEQLRALAVESGPALLARLRFAAVTSHGRPLVLLWAGPPNPAPPAMTVTALEFRPFQKLPNLFIPCVHELTPLPRRNTARALAPDPAAITVLLPEEAGGFVPLTVPETAFMPLADAIDHAVPVPRLIDPVLHRPPFEREPFEEFATPDAEDEFNILAEVQETSVRGDRPPQLGWWTRLRHTLKRRPEEPLPVAVPPAMAVADAVRQALPGRPPPADVPGRKHNLNHRRARLEARFLETAGPDDTATRLAVLPELAGLHAQLTNHADAAACWLNAIWDHDAPPPHWLWGWLQAEKNLGRLMAADDPRTHLATAVHTPSTVRVLAAMTVWLARQPAALAECAGQVRLVLEAHEEWLPVRAAWLAQVALAHTTGGDTLALARARDRLNDRIYHHGLSLERDVPAFLRFAGGEAGERFQAVRDWLDRVRDPIHRWADHLARNRPGDYLPVPATEYPDADGRYTKAIIDLMLAWGTARLGEQTPARLLAGQAAGFLRSGGDLALKWIADAFEYRVAQAAEAKPDAAAPAPDWAADNEAHLLAQHRVDILRAHLGILEPHRVVGRAADVSPDPLGAALRFDSELSSAFAQGDADAAARLVPQLARLFATDSRRFAELVDDMRTTTPARDPWGPDDLRRLESLSTRALRGLRRLGFEEPVERLQTQAVAWLLGGKELTQLRPDATPAAASALRAVLHIAADWFGGPHEDRAVTVLDFARKCLFYATELPTPQRLALAQAYAGALGHAHPRLAQGRVEELFRDLTGLYDVRQTNTHFALAALALVDAVVRAAVSDDFRLGPVARRWLDEDEFRVRARVQHDAGR